MVKLLTFNCQKGYQPGFEPFMTDLLESNTYDFILLQELNKNATNLVHSILENSEYKILNTFSTKANKLVEIAILYKQEYKLLESSFVSYSRFVRKEINEKGTIAGVFLIPRAKRSAFKAKKLLLTNIHVHAATYFIARRRELNATQRQIRMLDPDNEYRKIIGGDFNTLLPGEEHFNDLSLQPDFVNSTVDIAHTCNSKYIEAHFLPKTLRSFLIKFNLEYKFKIDHFYVDATLYKYSKLTSKALDTTVASDHLPVELTIQPIERRFNFFKRRTIIKNSGSNTTV